MIVLLIIAALLVGLTWAAFFKLSLPLFIALAVTGGVVLLVLAVYGIRFLRARRKAARQLEGEITQQAEEHAKTVRPDLQPEIQAMQAEFNKAVQALKSSKLARGGRDALAVLPWYLIVGPPGVGKSTALRNSGLKFPYLSGRGGGVRGVGGTRNCDWWLTNEAVLLDTAGRYSTGEEDRDEWLAFLDILARNRPRRPINGLIVAVSISDLLGVDPQAAGELGQRIRERLDELTSRLRIVVPVYMMITKCDLLTGFVEMFSDLPRSERGQILGFTVPMSAQTEAPTELFLERFDELTTVLEQRSLRRIGQERRLEARERIYQFPQRFFSLRKTLSELIQPLFMENVFQDTPLMRGVYFTSGTQEGRSAVEKVTSSMAELFGTAKPPEPQTDGRGYFLWDVFNKVMFQDQKMAIRSSMEELRQRKRRLVLAAGCLAAALATLVLPTVSYFQNHELAQGVHDAILRVQLDSRDDLGRIKDLIPLQQQLAALTRHRVEGAPFWMRLGLYRGSELFPLAQEFYNTALRRVLLGKQYDRLDQSLARFEESTQRAGFKADAETFGRDFNDLKMYLLITQPRGLREPPLNQEQQDWLVARMVDYWRNVKGTGGEAVSERDIRGHAQTYIAMLAADPEKLAFPRDDKKVRSARRALNAISREELKLGQIIAAVDQEYGVMTLPEIVGTVPAMSAEHHVRGAFTKAAFDQVVRARLDNAFHDTEAWVLDRDAKEDERIATLKLKTLYFQEYIKEWSTFLDSIHVTQPQDLADTQELLESLTRGPPTALGKLFRTLAYNVELTKRDKPGGTVSSVSSWVSNTFASAQETASPPPEVLESQSSTGEEVYTSRDVERSFSGLIKFATQTSTSGDREEKQTQLDYYQDQLRQVLKALRDVQEKPTETATLTERIRTSRREVENLISRQEAYRPLLTQILLPPLHDVSTLVVQGVAGDKSRKWCQEVAIPMRQLMEHHYPFDPNTLEEAPLAELAEFLRPAGGKLWKFYQEQLKEDMIAEGRRWRFINPQAESIYKGELLTFLEKATVLAATLFSARDTVDPQVEFQLMVHPATSGSSGADVSDVSFTLDGTEVHYENGPEEWKRLRWPGQAGKLGATLKATNRNTGLEEEIDEPGEWGLFRLLDRVKRMEPNGDKRSFSAYWAVDQAPGVELWLEIRPERVVNPFFGVGGNTSKLLQTFREPGLLPPLGIARNGQGCSVPSNPVAAPASP